MKKLLFGVLLAAAISAAHVAPAMAARCTGAADCRACTNCSRCYHCNEGGGTCGVKDGEAGTPVKSHSTRSKKAATTRRHHRRAK
jgi:hypothetical protein